MPTREPEGGGHGDRDQHRSRGLQTPLGGDRGSMAIAELGWHCPLWGNVPPLMKSPGKYGLLQICFLFLISCSMFSELQGTFKKLMIISGIKNQPFELSFFVPGDLVSPVLLSFPWADGEQLIVLQQGQYFTFFCLSFSIINLLNTACHFIINQLGKKVCLLIQIHWDI